MILPMFLQISLSIIGLVWISATALGILKSFVYYMKFQRFPMSQEEIEIKSLEEKVEFLTNELDDLRQEYSEITKSLLERAIG